MYEYFANCFSRWLSAQKSKSIMMMHAAQSNTESTVEEVAECGVRKLKLRTVFFCVSDFNFVGFSLVFN